MRTRLQHGRRLAAIAAVAALTPVFTGTGSDAAVELSADSTPATARVGTFPSVHRDQGLTPNPVPQDTEPQTTLFAKADEHKTLAEDSRGHVWTPSSLESHDLPSAALAAYKNAAATMARQDPSCHLPWTLLAGIGRVESDHGRYGGSVLGSDGVSRPAIIGIPLNGNGPVAAIPDTDNGRLDGDTVWDRAVGPMQFIPSTWAYAGRDGDGDGVKNPNDINDAALATAGYLCSGSGSMLDDASMKAAIFRYNPSDYYVALVQAFARGYQSGVFIMPSPPPPPGHDQPAGHHTKHTKKASGHQAATGGKSKPKPKGTPSAGSSGGAGGSGGSTSKPSPSTSPSQPSKPSPPSSPSPTPTPTPTPSPSPSGPTLVSLSGTLSTCPAGWCIASKALDLGPDSQLAAQAAHDFDGDGATETNAQELTGLVGTAVTLQVDQGTTTVRTINGVPYP